MSKVKLPLYDDNDMLTGKHIEINQAFFLDNTQSFRGRVVDTNEVADTDIPADPNSDEESNQNGLPVGWYEFIKLPGATTHIVHVGENSFYLPEDGVTPDDFFDAIDRGNVYRLVREIDVSRL